MTRPVRILVTGATGFVGRHVVPRLLTAGYEVHAVSSRATQTVPCLFPITADLLKPGEVERVVDAVRPELLLHLAWYAKHGSFWAAPENFAWADATARLLRAFHEMGGQRAVFAGTCAEYDWDHGYCVEGLTPTRPRTLYGKCKDATRQYVQDYCESRGLSYAWGRIFFPYGPGEPPGRLLPSVLRALMRNEPVRCSHGRQLRDFLHVTDVAAALVHLATATASNGAFNIASGLPVRLAELVDLCASYFPGHPPIQFGVVPVPEDDPPMLVGSPDRLLAIGWRAQVALEQGIEAYLKAMNQEGISHESR